MYKHKIIHKSYEQREDRVKPRQKDSQGSSEEELEEVDCNRYFKEAREERYTIEDLVGSLECQHEEEARQFWVETGSQEEDDDLDYCSHNSYVISSFDIEKLNARYMARISSDQQAGQTLPPEHKIRFSDRVYVKFFDCERPPADVCDAQQYTSSSQQYQQTSDENQPQLAL